MSSLTRTLVSVTLPLLVACVAETSRHSLRVQVRTADDWSDLSALGDRASRSAGVPVRDVSGVAPREFAMTLSCQDDRECDLAIERLSAEHSLVESVQRDARARVPPRPAAASAR